MRSTISPLPPDANANVAGANPNKITKISFIAMLCAFPLQMIKTCIMYVNKLFYAISKIDFGEVINNSPVARS
ncbi:protein of unknown function [Moritella yayanosii]|uniref:Uncharacterized protein n=1 Tax=Moritella yayanosii TaxID=69539 RepID=A0A330LQB8_9GAMM|nr:protein of unknown function [Moritella yayanosii]